MRLSKLLGKTLRQPPSEAHLVSHQLLVRGGYVRGLDAGLFAYLPLGHLALQRVQQMVERQLSELGGQPVYLPAVPETDPLAEQVRLVRREIDSYRQLPAVLFQTGSRPLSHQGSRAGLFGAAERSLVDISVFDEHESFAGQEVDAALEQLLASCDVPAIWAKAGDQNRRAYFAHPAGDEELARCTHCGYAAERSRATATWPSPPDEPEEAPTEIETPGCNTIATLAEFLGIPASKTLKMVFYSVEGRVNCIVIRGDRSVDEQKLARVLGTTWYYTSLEDELAAVGAVGGYASPIGLDTTRVRVVADPSVRSGKNFVSGANRPDYHIQNVNVPRDFVPGEWADLALIESGDPCPHCGAPLRIEAAFALVESVGPAPCQPGAEYLDPDGRAQPLWVANWQLDLGRLLAAIVENHHDDYGISWPVGWAPADIHLVGLDLRKDEVAAQATALYERLQAAGFRVLFDDRDGSPGVKFNDADLIGIPLRLTVSKRSVQEGLVEAKWRDSRDRQKLDDQGLAAELTRLNRI